MNWDTVSFDWNLARTFLVTVEEGSLSAAARVLGLSQPTVGRQVASLERELGVVLFERVGKTLIITPTGLELLEHVRLMCEAANNMSLVASGQSQTIEGLVRITASDVTAVYIVPKALKELRKIAPLIEVDVVATDNIQDLQHREADIAIRHIRPKQPDLIARLVNEATAHFYASRSYIDQYGCPETLGDVSGHHLIGYGESQTMIEFYNSLGCFLKHKNFLFSSQNGIVAWKMAREGLGIIMMSDEVAALAPDMVRVLPEMDAIIFPVWLTTHSELHTSKRIRLVFDFLADFLGKASGQK